MTMIIVNALVVVFMLSILIAWVSLAPWVPTRGRDLARVDKIAALKPGQTFVEMGCGNGRVCSYIARMNPRARVVGIELAYPFYLLSKLRALMFGPPNLRIVFGDALRYDISKADVIYTFALVDTMNRYIHRKIKKEMRKDARLISYVFSIKDWEGESESHKDQGKGHTIHVYSHSSLKAGGGKY